MVLSIILIVVIFIITLFILVIPHELGHLLVAKKFNIKALEFGFGIPPRIFGKKVGETLVSLNWLPFGGFVRLLGEDETDLEALGDKRSFAAASVGKRIAVVAAGVVINLLLAFLVFYIFLAVQGFKVDLPLFFPHNFVGVSQQNETLILVGGVSPNSPASTAGIGIGDRIVALNNQFVVSDQSLITEIKKDAGVPVNLTLSDVTETKFRTVQVTPRQNPPPGQGSLGVVLNPSVVAHLSYSSWWQKLLSAPLHSYNVVVYSCQVLGKLIGASFQTHSVGPVSEGVSGPIGIGVLIKQQIIDTGSILQYLNILAALSLNLAIFNVLPFPGLDGGRLLFLVIEAITKKRAPAVVERYVNTIGLAILIGLIFLVSLSDIKKFIF
jgi:regulator of sigma E protease